MQFGCADILVACYAFFNAVNNVDGGVGANVRGDENLLKLVKHFIVHLALTSNGTCDLAEYAGFGFFQSGIENFLFLFF